MVKRIALYAAIAVAVIGCSAQEEQAARSGYGGDAKRGAKHDAAVFISPEDDYAPVGGDASGSASIADRAQARGASLRVRVSKLDESETKVNAAIKDAGGFELTLNSSDLASANASLYIRAKVPVEKLDDVIAQIEGMGTRLSKTIKMQDLTAQLIAQQAEIKARKEHQSILIDNKDKKSKQQLARDHQVLEAMQSREAHIVARVTYADLDLSLMQGAVAGGNDDPNWWGQAYGQASTAAGSGFRVLATSLLWLLFMSPFYLPFVVVGWFVRRASKKRNPRIPGTPPVVNAA